jgi:hypothetical protein
MARLGFTPDDAPFSVALAWAARGSWDSALVVMDQYVGGPGESDSLARLSRYRLATIGAWVGALPAPEAVTRRDDARRVVPGLGASARAELALVDGILAVTQRDRPALADARRAAQASGDSNTAVLDQALAAFDRFLAGDTRQAGKALAAIEWQQADDYYPHDFSRVLMPVSRLAASEWLLASGDTATSARLLTWVEADIPRYSNVGTALLEGLAELQRARIEDAQGHQALAQAHYRRFLTRYDMPVPAHRHLVAEASEALARLSGRGDPPQPRAP